MLLVSSGLQGASDEVSERWLHQLKAGSTSEREVRDTTAARDRIRDLWRRGTHPPGGYLGIYLSDTEARNQTEEYREKVKKNRNQFVSRRRIESQITSTKEFYPSAAASKVLGD